MRINQASCTRTRSTYRVVLAMVMALGVNAADLESEINLLEAKIKQVTRDYMANYPAGNNDPRPVRQLFLGINSNDQSAADPSAAPSARLAGLLNQALELRSRTSTPAQLDRISNVIDLALETSLQGWMISGNISLLEGLRVSYPRAGDNNRPLNPPIPYGCLEAEFSFLSIKDSSRAQHFYGEGVRALATVLAGHAGNAEGKIIKDIDIEPIPYPLSTPGHFSSPNFPQYTWWAYISPTATNIYPIQTAGYMMGNLLQKQAQATQTIGYRLWTAGYFSAETRKNPATRKRLLDEAVNELHAGANLQFMSSVALAAVVGDKAETGLESPFDFTKIRNARVNINEARAVIGRIRDNEKPALPVDEIMAGDQQVNSLIASIESGPGSIARAAQTYETAKAALNRVQNNAAQVFADEQTRQTRFFDQLNALTGVDPDPTTIQTLAGQDMYRESVASLINTVLDQPNPDLTSIPGQSELLQAVKQVRYHRQELLNKKDLVDTYPARIKNLEDTLGANISAIQSAEGRITAAQLSIGFAQALNISQSVSVSYGLQSGVTFGTTISENRSAIPIAFLQNDITRASNLKEMRFLQNSTAEQIRDLLLEQNQALGALKTQTILLQNAEDDVRRVLGSTDRILAQLNHFNNDAGTLYYYDPAFNTALTAEEEAANREMDSLVAKLYKLGRLLELRWIEPFYNPVSVLGQNPQPIGGPEYDSFWSLESVFAISSVNVRDVANANAPWKQAENFFHALRDWDSKLRLAGIRDFDGDLGVVEISLRQDIYPYPDVKTETGRTLPLDFNPQSNPDFLADLAIRDNNRRRFRNLLLNNGRPQPLTGNKYRRFQISFPISYYDVGFTRGRLGDSEFGNLFGNITAWNYRIRKFKVKVIPIEGKSVFSQATTEFLFAQAGLISNVDFFESRSGREKQQLRVREFNLDNFVRYNQQSLNLTDQSAPYLLFSLARQNNYPTDAEVPTASNMGANYWSPFSSRWILEFRGSTDFEIENIDDIVLEMTLDSGAPNELQW